MEKNRNHHEIRPIYSLQRVIFEMLCLLVRRNVTMTADAMTIPDYVAFGLLLMMVLVVARWFAQRKFEL
jgi:hypothetical protein